MFASVQTPDARHAHPVGRNVAVTLAMTPIIRVACLAKDPGRLSCESLILLLAQCSLFDAITGEEHMLRSMNGLKG